MSTLLDCFYFTHVENTNMRSVSVHSEAWVCFLSIRQGFPIYLLSR